jgi:hypothetical protein
VAGFFNVAGKLRRTLALRVVTHAAPNADLGLRKGALYAKYVAVGH